METVIQLSRNGASRKFAGIGLLLLLGTGLSRAEPVSAAAPRVNRPLNVIDESTHVTRFRETHGLKDLPADESALAAALDRGYAALDIGLFDVRYPWNMLGEGKRIEELKELLLGLVDLHVRWLAWFDERELAPKAVFAPPVEVIAVRTWIAGWKGDAMRKALPAATGDKRTLVLLAGGNDAVMAALKNFAEGVRTGSSFGLKLDGSAKQLVLAPTRGEFVGFTAFVGSLTEEWKKLLWTTVLPFRIEFRLNQLQCLALERPVGDGTPESGTTFNDREKTGLLQHVTQYAADRLIRHTHGTALDEGCATGAAVDLVIELFGENNSRVAGSGEGHSTPARNKFVPGGRSSGGTLAKRNADSKWRDSLGKDWFISVLHAAQVEAAKLAIKERPGPPGPTAHFVLDAKDTPGEHELVTAPFLGTNAGVKDVPENFFGDYQEFLRAYRSGFVYWLSRKAKAKDEKAPPRPFARLLKACALDPSKPFEGHVAEIYGVPLSNPDATDDSLEWQFLAWLSHQK